MQLAAFADVIKTERKREEIIMAVEIGRLRALILADDRDDVKKMKVAVQLCAQTAKKIGGHFSSLRLAIPKISGGGILDAAGAVAGGNILTSVIRPPTGRIAPETQ